MQKRRHSIKKATVVMEEKRSRKWPQCLTLKNLQKLAAATGLCCYKPKNTQTTVRPHPVLRRAHTDSANETSHGLSQNEDNYDKGATLSSIESGDSLCSRVDYVQKTIECPLNDAQLQRDISRVVERLNYLLNLAENGNGPSNFTECNSLSCATAKCIKDTRDVQRHVPFKATWDDTSASLCIKLVPPQSTSNCCSRLDSDFSCSTTTVLTSSSHTGTPYILHRRLSARISADSGFFSTLVYILKFFIDYKPPLLVILYFFCIKINYKYVIVIKKQFY